MSKGVYLYRSMVVLERLLSFEGSSPFMVIKLTLLFTALSFERVLKFLCWYGRRSRGDTFRLAAFLDVA